MGLTDKIRDFIAPTVDELELTGEEVEKMSAYEQPKADTATKISSDTNIVLFEPRVFEEAEEIGKHIKSKRACCINLHRMPNEYRQRIIDFLSGVVYGVDGSIKKIDENVILCAPRNLQVGGNINLSNLD